VKPFLLLATRAEDAAADNEYASFLRFSGLAERDLRRFRLERRPLGDVDLLDWSGILLGGGPFNSSDPETSKSPVQQRVEADLDRLLDKVTCADFPFLGACYGIGTVGSHEGAEVDRRYAEPVGPVQITLTQQGRHDQLLGVLPESFDAFVGHKEAISELPPHAVLLASSDACPVQAFRIGSHVYATQFHPELDAAGLCTRIDVYKHAGYFEPDQADELKAQARHSRVTQPPAILRRFVDRYARGARVRATRVPVAPRGLVTARRPGPRTPRAAARPGGRTPPRLPPGAARRAPRQSQRARRCRSARCAP
jgi:GMP synthase (glutamine-hydrolysing)